MSQIATTVFNAAWESGIKIAERTAHALYISRYPTGRDATVNYPDVDLRYNRVRLALSTHSEGGITHKDIDLAARIDRMDGAAS